MKREIKLGLGVVLLIVPFIATASYAGESPISGEWAGSVVQVDFDLNGDGVFSNLIDAQIKGSFGMKSLHVLSEYLPVGLCNDDPYVWKLDFLYSDPIVTFANGDQLWGTMTNGAGSMCMDTRTSEFTGEGTGSFTGGTGRYEGATGTFTVTFRGKNLTLLTLGFGFAPISGDIAGTVVRP